jgi:hypothetical protein
MFGGHERHGGTMWSGSPAAPGIGWTCCERCPETTFASDDRQPITLLGSPGAKEEGT